jgi:hypothetical protein
VGSDGAVIQLVTRCGSADEFIERFARFTTATDVVVPALPHVSVGTAGRFVICLKDQSVMMKGQCEVTEIRAASGPAASGPPLMRLKLREMDAQSRGIHLRLMERHAASAKPPTPPPKPAGRTPLSLVPPLRSVPPPPVAAPTPAPAPAAKAPAVSTTQVMTSRPSASPRSAPAPAVTAPAPRAAVAAAAIAPPPSEPEKTEVSPTPRPEARVAGADFTLPANPLSDLDAADLASFVELTLLESNAAVPGAVVDAAPAASSVPTAIIDRKHLARAMAGPPGAAHLDRTRYVARRVAPYAVCVLAGLMLGIALKPGAKAPPPAVVAPSVAPPPVAVPAPPPAVPAPVEEIAAPAARECTARVTTTPVGAEVHWGDIALGPSPIAHAAVPCGTAIVTFRRERYADVSRTIVAERGPETVIAQRMNRPRAKLIVASSPPGAAVRFNKRRIGAAPRAIGFLRYEHVRLEVSSPGYEPWKKTLYLKDAETKVDVKLVRVSPAPARARTRG